MNFILRRFRSPGLPVKDKKDARYEVQGVRENSFLVYSFLFLVKEKINNIKKMQMIIIDFYSK